MLGCFNPTLGEIWTNPATGLKFFIKKKIIRFWLDRVSVCGRCPGFASIV